jgi:predicted nuclease of restriction endonuclease-like (RecB) superfamily
MTNSAESRAFLRVSLTTKQRVQHLRSRSLHKLPPPRAIFLTRSPLLQCYTGLMPETPLPSDYSAFLRSVKAQVQQAQLRALTAVNKELILLYWKIGTQILERQSKQGWGAGVIDQLSTDLHSAFPEMRGFSPRNLKYMRAFAKAYPDEQFVQQLAAQMPWGHHMVLLDKFNDKEQRKWYIQQAAEHGWSRNVLEHQIKTDLYNRSGKAITNFSTTLPALDSDLAQEALKDPYVFDFITTSSDTKERHLQAALITHIEHFLLELGVGFSFIGSNYRLEVGDSDYYLDLLFYHVRLRRYIVIELKTGKFKAEYVSKLNLYLTAVDRQIKQSDDQPTIGLILCTTKDTVTAEYALSDLHKPIGIATYETTDQLPEPLRDQLPAIRELERTIAQARRESGLR